MTHLRTHAVHGGVPSVKVGINDTLIPNVRQQPKPKLLKYHFLKHSINFLEKPKRPKTQHDPSK